jgi:RNA recognition motif-containing protein
MSSAVDNLADNLANASMQDPSSTAQDTVLASAAEGRRLYIGNLAYATTEGELKEFFKDYKVWVCLDYCSNDRHKNVTFIPTSTLFHHTSSYQLLELD